MELNTSPAGTKSLSWTREGYRGCVCPLPPHHSCLPGQAPQRTWYTTAPQAQGGLWASVPSSWLSHDDILVPTPHARAGTGCGMSSLPKASFHFDTRCSFYHWLGHEITFLVRIFSHCEQPICLLNADKENFIATVALLQHPKPINMLGLFVLTWNSTQKDTRVREE